MVVRFFYFLDDPANPLALKWRLGIGSVTAGAKAGLNRDSLEVVKITYLCNPARVVIDALERALVDRRRVDVVDIYFSFNSAELRKASDMRRHGDWKGSQFPQADNLDRQDDYARATDTRRAQIASR